MNERRKVERKRLRAVAGFLSRLKLGEQETYDMQHYFGWTPECGTSACALGYLGFREKHGFSLGGTVGGTEVPWFVLFEGRGYPLFHWYQGRVTDGAFGLDREAWTNLFGPRNEDTHPKQTAKRILAYLRETEGKR
jgi:hypothetical protein